MRSVITNYTQIVEGRDSVIKPYKVMNLTFTTFYGIITEPRPPGIVIEANRYFEKNNSC